MKFELTPPAIIDSFNKTLPKLSYIDPSLYQEINDNLKNLSVQKTKYETAIVAAKIWKLFFRNSLSAITRNPRGKTDIFRYVDEMIDYEDVLFSLDPHHREHIIHSVWVMLLGLFLIEQTFTYKTINHDEVFTTYTNNSSSEQSRNNILAQFKQFELPIWCLIALTHDLGYPIQKTRIANQVMAKMINNFGFLNLKDFEYAFTVIHQPSINELLNNLSSAIICEENHYTIGLASGLRIDNAKSFENLDHGIMSSYLLQNKLDWICDVLPFQVGSRTLLDAKSAVQVALVLTLLKSVASHTNKNSYDSRIDTLSGLLFICDEIEEFARYHRSEDTHEWIESKIRTELDIDNSNLSVIFTFQDIGKYDPDENRIKKLYLDKIKKLHFRFELSDVKDEINHLSVLCKDITKTPNEEFFFDHKNGSDPIKEHRTGDKIETLDFAL